MIQQNKAIKLLIILIFILSFVPIFASAAPFAYITNYFSNNVSVIDTSTNTVTATVAAVSSPYGVAVNPTVTRVYVSNLVSASVSVINTSNNTVTATVAVGSSPRGVAVNPAGTHVYVSNEISNNVSVIDTSTNTVTATIAVGTNPYGVAVNPAGTHVYVSNYGSNSVSVIDTSSNTVIATVAVGTNPYGVAVNPAGTRVYVSNYFSNSVSVIDTSTNSVIDTVTPVISPWGVAVNPAGTCVYVSNYFSNSVSVIDTSSNSVTDTVTVGSNPIAYGIFISPEGASDTTASTIYVNTTGWWRDGGAFNTSSTRIQAAIDNSTAGDTIYVYNGTYAENVNVNEQVTLQGEGADVVTVTNSTADSHVFNVTMDYVNISGFNVTGATADEFAGIYLGSAEHCYISDNIASGNFNGISLYSSSYNTLTNNTANSNELDGISLYSSSYNTLTNNTANSNDYSGIYLEYSSSNTLTNNTDDSNNYYGFELYDSSENILTNSTADSNNYSGIYLESSMSNTLTNNTANSNNYCHGIELYNSSYNTLANNTANSNYYDGIELYNSSYNTLTNNTAYLNDDDGIGLYDSTENTLKNNTINSNNNSGIYLESSNSNTLTNNTANSNNYYHGIELYNSSYNTLSNNTANSNYYGGIELYNSSFNTLTNNTINLNNNSGIYLESSMNNTLTNNTANSNYYDGIELYNSSYNTIKNNSAYLNDDDGIGLYDSTENTLTNNTINSNNNSGIYLESSNSNTLTNNTINSNNYSGIYLQYSTSNNTIYNNYFNNTNNAYDDGNNIWNTTKTTGSNIVGGSYLGGNYWSDYAGTDMNSDGLGDTLIPYNSSGNILNGGDYYPLVTTDNTDPVVNTVTLNKTTPNTGDAILITVNATDNVAVTNVTADGFELTPQSGNTWNGTITAIEGTQYVNVSAKDAAGNTGWNNSTSYIATTTDNIDPVITIVTPTASSIAYKSGGQQMYVNFTYVEANPKNYTIQIRNTTAIINATSATTTSSPVNVSFTMNATAADGYYNVTVIMWDNATNTNTATEVNAVLMDSTPPTAPTIDVPANGETLASANTWVNGTTDTDTANVTVYVNGSIKNASVAVSGNTFNISNVPLGADGAYEINVSTKDAAGNVNTTNASVTVTVDKTPPNVPTITVPTDGALLTTSNTWVNGTMSTDTANVTVYVNGLIKNASVTVSGTVYNISNVPLGADGANDINVSAMDAAGNVNTTNASVTVNVDTTKPIISIVTPTASSKVSKKGGQQIYVNFTYVEANPKNYTVQIRNATAIINSTTDTTTYSPVNISFTMNATAAEGYYNVTVTMWDNASHTNTTTEVDAVIIDITPPTSPTNLIHTDDAPDGYDNDNSTDISWSPSTDVSTVIYRIYKNGTLIDSTESETYTFTNEIEDPDPYEYNVSAIDSAGNINTTNASVKVIVDYTDPVIHNVSLTDYTTSYGQQIVVSVNATDIITNITSVTAGSTQLTHQSGMLWNGTITAGYGTNIVIVTAYDNASNTAINNNLSYTGPAAPKDSRGSSGGGGVGGSDEPENVEESAILRIYLASGSSSTYNFDNIVTSVEVTPDRTYGLVAAKMEVLHGRPGSITTDPPNGVLFKYVNVFVGTSGWSEDKFSSSVINFQIPTSWFEDNNIDPVYVTLYRYHDGEWQPLATTMTGQADEYYQYSSPTPGFSTFMILGQVGDSCAIEPVAKPDSGTVAGSTATHEATSTSDKGIPGFGILLGIMGVLMAVYLKRK